MKHTDIHVGLKHNHSLTQSRRTQKGKAETLTYLFLVLFQHSALGDTGSNGWVVQPLAQIVTFINHIFQPLYNRYGPQFKNYIDNCSIFIYKGKLDLYQQIMCDFFDILQKHSLFLKPSKCLFEAPEINFLRLQLTLTSITIAPDKLSTIADWPCTPRNLKELQKILGVLSYQCPFILNFVAIA